jgi:uncharacterized protein YjbI with pentapeptide repeats
MSESTEISDASPTTGIAWGDAISAERASELEALLRRWEEGSDRHDRAGPFARVRLTGADVFWLASRARSEISTGGAARTQQADSLTRAVEHVSPPGGAPQDENDLPVALYIQSMQRAVQIVRTGVHLEEADLSGAHLEGADLSGAHLERCALHEAHLQGANLRYAHLEGAQCGGTDLQDADLRRAHLEGARLLRVNAKGTIFWMAYFDAASDFYFPTLSDATGRMAQFWATRWGNMSLAYVDWSQVPVLEEERKARRLRRVAEDEFDIAETNSEITPADEYDVRQHADPVGQRKRPGLRMAELREAVQANQQLATVLRSQDLHEAADHFAYRGLVLQRILLRRRHRYARYLGSGLLDLVAGYGYRPLRAFLAYALVILAFAALFLLNAPVLPPQLTWDQALVLSISSFHGRGFFPSGLSLSDTLARLAAGEAIIGLLIELSFIATFTQRFLGK